MNVGIIAACLPTIKPLFVTFFEKARAITAGRSVRTQDRSGYFEQRETSGHCLSDLGESRGHTAHVISVHRPRKHDRIDDGSESDEVPLNVRKGAIVKTREVLVS
jgi:hypothetical protein